MSVCRSVCLSVCLSVRLSVCLSTCVSARISRISNVRSLPNFLYIPVTVARSCSVCSKCNPSRSRTVQIGERSAKGLSPRAADAKRGRRRLQRRTHAESDRVAYRVSCREANLEINSSRDFFQERVTTAGTDQKARWRMVPELLHTDDRREESTPEQAQRLCLDFSSFLCQVNFVVPLAKSQFACRRLIRFQIHLRFSQVSCRYDTMR